MGVVTEKSSLSEEHEIQRKIQNRKNSRWKRSFHNELFMELGFFVDQAVWDKYEKKYGKQAETELDNYVEAVLDVVQADYAHLEPKIHIEVTM